MHPRKNLPLDFKDMSLMSRDEVRQEIERLREEIEYHNYLYYVKDQPQISDATYDKLFRRLQELEKTFPEFQSPASPTQRVGGKPAERLKKLRHAAPMLSLNAVLEEKEVSNFVDFIHRNAGRLLVTFILEPKFDGVSIEVVYREGVFQSGTTRGDGETGEDISENLKTIYAIPLQLQPGNSLPRLLSVRGEVLMLKKGFTQLNKELVEKGKEPFANPRNAAAGLVRQLDPRMVAGRPLDVRFYEVLSVEDHNLTSHWDRLEQFQRWGLKTDHNNKKCASLQDIKTTYQELLSRREELEYEIDGVVIKLDNLELREQLGTRQRSPRWALAWKFPPKEQISRIQDIVVQVGRTGILTPVALLEPVDVGGVTISRATLHNEDEIHRKDIRVGDNVRVARAGDVIPEVIERFIEPGGKRGEDFHMPIKCPACGTTVAREGAYYVCPAGLSCPAQLVGHIVHYASREAMNMEGLSEKTATQLVDKSLVKDVADLYQLSIVDILTLEGFAQKSATKLYQSIQSSKQARFDRFLYALGIRHVGQHVAFLLASKFRTLENLQKAVQNGLGGVPGVGPQITASISDFFSREKNKRVLQRLIESGVKIESMPGGRLDLPLKGKIFVFTGSLKNYTRPEASSMVEALGGQVKSSLGSGTDFLVVGEKPGSKLDAAREQGVKVIGEAEFERLVGK